MSHNHHAKTNLLTDSKGFALIEIVVGMMILAVVMMSAYTMFSSGLRISGKLTGDVDVRNDIRKAGNQIVKDIQQSTGVAESEGNFVFSLADGNNVTYYYDANKQVVMRRVSGNNNFSETAFIDSLDTDEILPFSIQRAGDNDNEFVIEIWAKNNNNMARNTESELHSFFAVRRTGVAISLPPPPPGGQPPAITAFDLLASNNPGLNVNVYGTINQETKEIFIYYPYGVILTSLVPTIQISGTYTAVSPHPNTPQNFFASSPVTYITYRLHYGNNEHVDYLVSVRVGPDNIREFIPEVFIFGANLVVENNARVSGSGSSVYIRGSGDTDLAIGNNAEITVRKIFISSQEEIMLENNAVIGWASTETFIQGPVELANNAILRGTAHINGNFLAGSRGVEATVNVNGNVRLENLARNSSGTINYTGTLTNHSGTGTLRVNRVASVPGFQIPQFAIPGLQSDSWYAARGYTASPVMRNNMKFFGTSFDNSGHGTFTNVIIVSKNDIEVGGNYRINSGIFFAPNGVVEIGNNVQFTGVIIAKEIIIKNNAQVTFQAANMADLPF
jgi:prepilin-type N-terminal cleavage/methylation domain-containing protein